MFYPWWIVVQRAQQEHDRSKLHECVLKAEEAIFERTQQLHASGDEPAVEEERRHLRTATSELLKIKTDRLKWPPVAPH
jgi:hypothetical protein